MTNTNNSLNEQLETQSSQILDFQNSNTEIQSLYDEFGRIVDMNNGDYSFTLELEYIYDL